MWLKATSSAYYIDSSNEIKTIKMQHWLSQLNVAQKKQVLDEQKREKEYLEEIGYDPNADQDLSENLTEPDPQSTGSENDTGISPIIEMERKLNAGEISVDEFMDWAIGQ